MAAAGVAVRVRRETYFAVHPCEEVSVELRDEGLDYLCGETDRLLGVGVDEEE